MVDLDALPGIEYWGARRIDQTISADAAGGALVGILLASPLSRIATVVASVARQHGGLIAGHVAWYLGWLVAAYAALLVIAYWSDIDEEDN